jgi:hypothetical protein
VGPFGAARLRDRARRLKRKGGPVAKAAPVGVVLTQLLKSLAVLLGKNTTGVMLHGHKPRQFDGLCE